MLAGLRGDRSVRDVCREHEIAETLFYQWRDRGCLCAPTAHHRSSIGRRSGRGHSSSCVPGGRAHWPSLSSSVNSSRLSSAPTHPGRHQLLRGCNRRWCDVRPTKGTPLSTFCSSYASTRRNCSTEWVAQTTLTRSGFVTELLVLELE